MDQCDYRCWPHSPELVGSFDRRTHHYRRPVRPDYLLQSFSDHRLGLPDSDCKVSYYQLVRTGTRVAQALAHALRNQCLDFDPIGSPCYGIPSRI